MPQYRDQFPFEWPGTKRPDAKTDIVDREDQIAAQNQAQHQGVIKIEPKRVLLAPVETIDGESGEFVDITIKRPAFSGSSVIT